MAATQRTHVYFFTVAYRSAAHRTHRQHDGRIPSEPERSVVRQM